MLSKSIFGEPLAPLIIADSRIKGILGGDREHELFLYADDILVLCQDPVSSGTFLLQNIEEYSTFSGYCINWHKSEAMPISQSCLQNHLATFNFKWLPRRVLGIVLYPEIKEIMTINMGGNIKQNSS